MICSFSYQKNQLCVATDGGAWTPIKNWVQKSNGHPFYLYSSHSILRRLHALQGAFAGVRHKIHYAVKANSHASVLEIFRQHDCGVDVVSGGEAHWSLEHGFKAKDILFSGVGKSKSELEKAITQNFYQINIESLPEIERIGKIASQLKTTAHIGLRINPNIRVNTHPYITTGFRENKFGIPEEQIQPALQLIQKYAPFIHLQGLSVHIGSQIRELAPLIAAVESIYQTSQFLTRTGHTITTLDIGGGVGIDYHSEDESEELQFVKSYGDAVTKILKDFQGTVLLEPGRFLVARAGVLCTQVEYIKNNGHKNFVIVNSGMNHLMRPSLYKAHHRILPISPCEQNAVSSFDVVGPICESSDVLGADRLLHEPTEGDVLAIMDAGAYGMSMASQYNHHGLPTEIVI